MEATQSSTVDPQTKALVRTWMDRIKAANKHWERLHNRADYNRKVVRGIDDAADVKSIGYNKERANLINSTLQTVQSRVYAKNPEMTGIPTNNSANLKLFASTLGRVTQAMLEDAGLKKQGKRAVRASMIASYGALKIQYQRDMRTDPIIKRRIEDAQDNLVRIESLIAEIEDDSGRADLDAKKAELTQAIKGLEAQQEVVASEGLAIDLVRTGRLCIDPGVEDILDYEQAGYIIETIPMRRSIAEGLFKRKLEKATVFKLASDMKPDGGQVFGGTTQSSATDDPVVMVYEVWSKQDTTIYTLVEGLADEFVRDPYTPEKLGERWYPFFILPFQPVDGHIDSQSMVDFLEKLQEEHNKLRDKEADLRDKYNPHYITGGDTNPKDIESKLIAGLGEVIIVKNSSGPINQVIQPGVNLVTDPAMFNPANISRDWEMVSGLQDAARSTVVRPKTATEASIMDQSLAARVAEFRDVVEDYLSEIAKYASELCLFNMTQPQVKQIMGDEECVWIDEPSPDKVFGLVQLKIRAGSTVAPNKLEQQDTWMKAVPVITQMIAVIRQVEAQGGDASPEREMLRETAQRFDESIDIERFLPIKPAQEVPQIPGFPGMPMAGGDPASIPLQ